jgi:hypothetical protein
MKRKVSWQEQAEEIWAVLRETQANIKAVSEEQKLLAKEMRQLSASQEKTGEEIRKTGEEIEKVNKMVGDLTSGWGKFVEGLIEPSGIKLAHDLGINIRRVLRRVKAFWDEKETEVDIILEGERNGKRTLLVIDVKSDYEPSDMRHFLNWFKHFFNYFDIYRDYEVLVAVAASRFGNGVEVNVLKKGFYLMTPQDNIMKITSPKKPMIKTKKTN